MTTINKLTLGFPAGTTLPESIVQQVKQLEEAIHFWMLTYNLGTWESPIPVSEYLMNLRLRYSTHLDSKTFLGYRSARAIEEWLRGATQSSKDLNVHFQDLLSSNLTTDKHVILRMQQLNLERLLVTLTAGIEVVSHTIAMWLRLSSDVSLLIKEVKC